MKPPHRRLDDVEQEDATKREILVVGVTGRVGSRVATALADGHGVRCRGLVRAMPANRSTPYRPFLGDLSEIDTLAEAVDGCDAVFVCSPLGPDQVALQTNLVRAVAASAKKGPILVKLSGFAVGPNSEVDSGRWHFEIERELRQSGLEYVTIRPNFFMQNLRVPLMGAAQTGVYTGPTVGRIAMVDEQDVADVAAHCLLRGVQGIPRIVVPTASKSCSSIDVARFMSEALGKRVRFEPMSGDALRSALSRGSMPRWHVDVLVQFHRAFERGLAEETSDHVERLLGRAPVELEEVIADMSRGD